MIQLHHVEAGVSDRSVLLLHGFMGSAEAMGGLLSGLARDSHVVAVDLVGHGASPAPAEIDAYSAPAMIHQVAEVLARLGLTAVDVVGYSMGARLGLQFAVHRPELVERLVTIGANPGLADSAEREGRVRADQALADDIERDGVEAFVDRWESLALFESQRSLPDSARAGIRRSRLEQRPLGLANSLRGFGAGSMDSLWDRLGTIQAPVLAVAGELDSKFVGIAEHIGAAVPNAEVSVVAGVGHATHLEDLDATLAAISEFLCR